MLGGLARRAALVEKLRGEGPVFVVDSGDLFFSGPPVPPATELEKAKLIGRSYRRMGAAAVNVGNLDLLQGLDFLHRESASGLPLISANLLDGTNKSPLFPPFVIREVSGTRIAFFGLLFPGFKGEIGAAIRKATEEKILVKDPVETAKEVVGGLSGKADLVILLSNLGLQMDNALAKSVPGIHFILGGREGRAMLQPNQEGMTYIVQSGAKGMYLGRLKITVQSPVSPFQDRGMAPRIQEQLRILDLRLSSLQKAKEKQPNPDLDRLIQSINQQKTHLQEERRRLESESSTTSSSFLWTLEPIERAVPEEKEIQGWIREAGIEKD